MTLLPLKGGEPPQAAGGNKNNPVILLIVQNDIPHGSRPTARVLLLDASHRLLLLHAEETSNGHRFWLAPGGGLEGTESFEAAARRELHEETGLDAAIGPWVWTRHHIYTWNGKRYDQYERFFVARTEDDRIHPQGQDRYVIGHQWWSLQALQASTEDFAPRKLAQLLPDIVMGKYPNSPIDCGI